MYVTPARPRSLISYWMNENMTAMSSDVAVSNSSSTLTVTSHASDVSMRFLTAAVVFPFPRDAYRRSAPFVPLSAAGHHVEFGSVLPYER
jgi:hypothetical protein